MPAGYLYANLVQSCLKDEYDSLPKYFKWRKSYIANSAAAGNGDGLPELPSPQFLVLYAAELLYNIEQTSPLESLRAFARLMRSYGKMPRVIRNRLRRWMRDFYLLHANSDPPRKGKNVRLDYNKPDRFDFPFSHFMFENKLTWLYPEYVIGLEFDGLISGSMSADEIFDMYADVSSYNIKASRLVREGYGKAVRDAFIMIWGTIGMRIKEGGQNVSSVFVDSRPVGSWMPYHKLEVRKDRLLTSLFKSGRRFDINIDAHRNPNPLEKFRFRSSYMAQLTEARLKANVSDFFGDIMKRIDCTLRDAVGFPNTLAMPESNFSQYMTSFCENSYAYVDRTALHGIPINAIITNSVKNAVNMLPEDTRQYKKPVSGKGKPAKKSVNDLLQSDRPENVKVSIDFTKLNDVRSEADWVFGRLTEDRQSVGDTASAREASDTYNTSDTYEASDTYDAYSATEDTPDLPDADGWSRLAASLNDTQKRVLRLLASGRNEEALDAIRHSGHMTETFAETVNAASLGAIGDILIETDGRGISLIDEYMEEVRKAI